MEIRKQIHHVIQTSPPKEEYTTEAREQIYLPPSKLQTPVIEQSLHESLQVFDTDTLNVPQNSIQQLPSQPVLCKD